MNAADFAPVYGFRGLTSTGAPATVCAGVHDGDTILVRLALPVWTYAEHWVRLRFLWAPELHEPGGPEAKAAMEGLVLGRPVWARTFKAPRSDDPRRSFVRLLGDVGIDPGPDGALTDLARAMAATGLAAYDPARTA